jgi:hypothetical protein
MEFVSTAWPVPEYCHGICLLSGYAGISLSVFIRKMPLKSNEAGVSCFGQRVYRIKGELRSAKKDLCRIFKKL